MLARGGILRLANARASPIPLGMNVSVLLRLLLVIAAVWFGGCAGNVRNTSRTFTCVVIDAGMPSEDVAAAVAEAVYGRIEAQDEQQAGAA